MRTSLGVLIVATLWATASYAQVPVGYWNFDEPTGSTVFDVTGNGNDGTIDGATRVAGFHGTGALSFDGSNDAVDIVNNAALNFVGSGTLTAMAWVNPSGPAGGVCCGTIVGQRAATTWILRDDRRDANEFELLASTNAANFQGDGGGDGVPQTPIGEWHHIAAVLDLALPGGEAQLYVDGVLSDTYNINGTMLVGAGTPTTIGGRVDGFFNGQIDEVKIFDVALTQDQIVEAMQPPTSNVVPEPASVAIWSLVGVALFGFGTHRLRRRSATLQPE